VIVGAVGIIVLLRIVNGSALLLLAALSLAFVGTLRSHWCGLLMLQLLIIIVGLQIDGRRLNDVGTAIVEEVGQWIGQVAETEGGLDTANETIPNANQRAFGGWFRICFR